MTHDMFPEAVSAKCCCCGCSFEYRRHEGFSCPWCAAYFDSVEFSQNKAVAFFVGQRWSKWQGKPEDKMSASLRIKLGIDPSPSHV